MSLIIVYPIVLITSLLWGLWPGITDSQVYLGAGDFEIYTCGVVIIAFIASVLSKSIGNVYADAFSLAYFIAAIVKFSTLVDIELVYMISDTYFDILTAISIILVLLERRADVHS